MTPSARLTASIEVFADIEARRRPAAQALKDAQVHGERDEHERGERRPDGDDRPGGEDVLQRDLDEEIRRAPERAEQEKQGDGSARHPYRGSQNIELTPNCRCLAGR